MANELIKQGIWSPNAWFLMIVVIKYVFKTIIDYTQKADNSTNNDNECTLHGNIIDEEGNGEGK